MKAFIISKPFDAGVFEVDMPTPADDEVLIKVAAAGFCGTDIHTFKGEHVTDYPIIPGHEFSGTVVAIGSKVTQFKSGDPVICDPTGIQHIGISTYSLDETLRFFQLFGFQPVHYAKNGKQDIVFLRCKNVIIEAYTEDAPAGQPGAIDHISLDVDQIDVIYEYCQQIGLIPIEGKICELPFWEHGIRYFTVMGPNGEKIEFCQINS